MSDKEDISKIISEKESEINSVLMREIEKAKKENENNKKIISELQTKNQVMLDQIDEYKKEISSQKEIITTSDLEAQKLKKGLEQKESIINELNKIIKNNQENYEKEKFDLLQKEKLAKLSVSKVKSQYEDQLIQLERDLNKVRQELKNQKFAKENVVEDFNKFKDEKLSQTQTFKFKLQMQNESIEKYEKLLKTSQEDLNDKENYIIKLKNENFKLIKQKAKLENTIKKMNSDLREDSNNVYLSNQRCKIVTSELIARKEENSKLQKKIDKLYQEIDQLKEEVFNSKQSVQVQEFEVQKEKLKTKVQNEKIIELEGKVTTLSKEKSIAENNYLFLKQDFEEQKMTYEKRIKITNEEMDEMKNKITELINTNNNLKETKEKIETKKSNAIRITKSNESDSVQDAINFFNKASQMESKEENLLKSSNEFTMQMKQKDLEIERLRGEFQVTENQYLAQIEEFKQNENEMNQEIIQYKEIVHGLEEKVTALDHLYNEEKEKIKKELEETTKKYQTKIKKYKKENQHLIKLSSDLKIELSRAENKTLCRTQNLKNDFQNYEYNPNFSKTGYI